MSAAQLQIAQLQEQLAKMNNSAAVAAASQSMTAGATGWSMPVLASSSMSAMGMLICAIPQFQYGQPNEIVI